MDRRRPTQNPTPSSTKAMAKIAGFMQRFGLDCTPPNFELVHSVLAGESSELREEFAILGRDITQEQLDELIRKYASHHVEDGIAAESIDAVGKEINDFLSIVDKESSALADYDRVLKEQSRGLKDPSKLSPERLQNTIANLSAATERKIEQGEDILKAVNEKAERLGEVADNLNTHVQNKLVDPLTELPNRRAFNKEALAIYRDGRTADCCMAFVEIDGFNAMRENYGALIADKFILHVSEFLKASRNGNDYLARSGSHAFAFIFWGIAESTAETIAKKFSQNILRAPLLNSSNGQPIAKATVSTGICQSNKASGTGDILAKTEATLTQAKSKNGGHVCLFGERQPEQNLLERKDYMLYQP